jgi:hypothetical protein
MLLLLQRILYWVRDIRFTLARIEEEEVQQTALLQEVHDAVVLAPSRDIRSQKIVFGATS